jgi:hypothetical protein
MQFLAIHMAAGEFGIFTISPAISLFLHRSPLFAPLLFLSQVRI